MCLPASLFSITIHRLLLRKPVLTANHSLREVSGSTFTNLGRKVNTRIFFQRMSTMELNPTNWYNLPYQWELECASKSTKLSTSPEKLVSDICSPTILTT